MESYALVSLENKRPLNSFSFLPLFLACTKVVYFKKNVFIGTFEICALLIVSVWIII